MKMMKEDEGIEMDGMGWNGVIIGRNALRRAGRKGSFPCETLKLLPLLLRCSFPCSRNHGATAPQRRDAPTRQTKWR